MSFLVRKSGKIGVGGTVLATPKEKFLHGVRVRVYLATPLAFNPRRRGSLGTIFVKFCMVVSGWLATKWHKNIAENFDRLSRVHER